VATTTAVTTIAGIKL